MKRIDILTAVVLVIADYVLLMLAGITSYSIRYQGFITQFRPVFFDYPFAEFLPLLFLIAAIGVIFFGFTGLYRITPQHRPLEQLTKIFLGVSTTILVVIVSIFLRRELFSSRFVIIVAWGLGILYVAIGHAIVAKIKSEILRQGRGVHGIAIIGIGKAQEHISRYYEQQPQLGYRVIGCYADFNTAAEHDIHVRHQSGQIDSILNTSESMQRDLLERLIVFCAERSIDYEYVASSYQMQISNFETTSVAGYPIIHVNKTRLRGWGRVVKRLFDLVIASSTLVIVSPVMLIIAVVVKVTSDGPVIVGLDRVGRAGKHITVYKFRSMVKNAHAMKPAMASFNERADGPLFKMKDDPRVTPLGAILRKTSLDELPQFWNVLKGTMSLVGPRPHEPEEVERYGQGDKNLLTIKPGITGLAQVSGRSSLLFSEESRLDLYYIEHWSLALDLQILARTAIAIFSVRGAF